MKANESYIITRKIRIEGNMIKLKLKMCFYNFI